MQAKSGAPWIGVLDDPEAFLGELGWQVSLTQAGQPDAHYERWTLPFIPTQMPGMPHNWFVTAQNFYPCCRIGCPEIDAWKAVRFLISAPGRTKLRAGPTLKQA
jgi:hypothetical protein